MKNLIILIALCASLPTTSMAFSMFDDANAESQDNNFVERDRRGGGRGQGRWQGGGQGRGQGQWQGGGQGRGQGRGGRGQMLKKLGLNEEQIAQFKEIKQKHKQSMQGNRERIKNLKQEFQQLMQSNEKGDGYKSKVLSKLDELQRLKAQTKRSKVEMALSIREIMTPEQIQKFMQFRQQRKGRKNGRGGQRQGRRQGRRQRN
jgi:Spy/CpxP family protein refolding chaperone